MRKCSTRFVYLALAVGLGTASLAAQGFGGPGQGCSNLPSYAALQNAIATATAAETSGLNNQMWATIVNRDGVVCAVAFSGVNRGAQWPGSRVISAQKANTANSFSLDASSSSGGSGQSAASRFLPRICSRRSSLAAAFSDFRKATRWIPQSPTADRCHSTERRTIRWWATESEA